MRPYAINLTDDNLRSLEWAAARGYFPEGWLDRLESDGRVHWYRLTEPMAWELREFQNEDEHAFLSCMPDDVVSAVLALLDSVV